MTIVVVFIGPAGSGKTSLTKSYGEWLKKNMFLKTAFVNLDPGVEDLPYRPLFDIRKYFTLSSIMKKYGLGPNGAFLKASELISEYIDEIFSQQPFNNLNEWDIVLIDTPGQMEAFIFRPVSNVFFNKLKEISNPVIVFILDASTINTLSDAITLWFLHILVQVKTGLTVVPVINKIDLAENTEYARILVEEPGKFIDLIGRGLDEGLLSDIAMDLVRIAVKTRSALRSVMVSALKQDDYTELHSLVHEAYCTCGDLT